MESTFKNSEANTKEQTMNVNAQSSKKGTQKKDCHYVK